MSGRLPDPGLVRRLRRACRRAGGTRVRWWRRQGDLNQAAFRAVLAGLIAASGILVPGRPELAVLPALVALWLVFVRLQQVRGCLHGDPALAALAQLPLTPGQVYTHQMRGVRPAIIWSGVDAAAFWAVAWHAQGWDAAWWWWLPAVGATQALLIHAMALLLAPTRLNPGCWPQLLLIAITVAALHHGVGLTHAVEPVLRAISWTTPAGWLGLVAVHMPTGSAALGLGLLGLLLAAAAAARLAGDRLRLSWRPAPGWREWAGQPGHELDDDEDGPVHVAVEPSSGVEGCSGAIAVRWEALRRAVPGGSLGVLGHGAARVGARLDSQGRRLADLLHLQSSGPPAWRWALLAAGLPAATALIGQSPLWAAGLLAAVVLWRAGPWLGIPAAILPLLGLIWPIQVGVLCLLLPVAVALMLVLPIAGGTWLGLPMGMTVLGLLPRSWNALMRVMLLSTVWRLIASLPVVAAAAVAWGLGVHPALGGAVLGLWAALLLAVPTLSALQLIRRTPGGIADIGLGGGLRTAVGAALLLVLGGGLVAVMVGAGMAAESPREGLPIAAGGTLAGLIASALLIPLLRRAYRRWIDLVPPL